jgi:hypothetical protein
MGKIFDVIDERLEAWIARQRMYFVGTAPSGSDGHVNVSPKGPIETLRVLDERTLAYLDLVGSGADRIADSCGYGVPLMHYEGQRPQLRAWAERKLAKQGPTALEDYKDDKNAVSIDGLPALR